MEKNSNNLTNRDGLLLRFESRSAATTSSDFVLQWGNRKRLRCMKVQGKDHSQSTSGTGSGQRGGARIDRRVVRSDLNGNINTKDPNSNPLNNGGKTNGGSNGPINLRQRSASPSHRILRNSETSLGMRGQSNGLKGLASPDRDCRKSANNNTTHHHCHNKSRDYHNDNHSNPHAGVGVVSRSSEATHDAKKGGSAGGLSSSGDQDAVTTLWLPKFAIALTNKEKEEDFMAFKGSKLSQRPKKRAKFIQRTLNLVIPGAWLSDLTLERYEVREKKVSKKRPRGLKAMGTLESESE